jgi:outer membrane cobalamin receptor
MKHSIALTMPGLAIVLAQVGGVNAQESSLALEEVIVTATKREQNLQDVSVAVTGA